MRGSDLHIYLDDGLSEDASYEVTRRIKALDGVLTVTLGADDVHHGLVVLSDSADRSGIAESVRAMEGVSKIVTPNLAA